MPTSSADYSVTYPATYTPGVLFTVTFSDPSTNIHSGVSWGTNKTAPSNPSFLSSFIEGATADFTPDIGISGNLIITFSNVEGFTDPGPITITQFIVAANNLGHAVSNKTPSGRSVRSAKSWACKNPKYPS